MQCNTGRGQERVGVQSFLQFIRIGLPILSRKRPLIKDDLQWKTTFDERRPLTEDNLHIAGRHTALDRNENDPKEEDDLRWKTTFDGRQLLKEDNF